MFLKHSLICILFVLALIPNQAYSSCWFSSVRLYWCARSQLGYLDAEEECSWNAMKEAYYKMKSAKCINCDKYFHCIGNYNAVYRCQRSETNRRTAEIISDCRENVCKEPDAGEDQRANRFGRYGGNCAAKYLCANNCKYNPADSSCKKSNC